MPAGGRAAGRAADDVLAAIEAAGGAIPFSAYMAVALYGPHGFYTAPDGGGAGRRGDFLTAPEVGPLFGLLVGRYLDSVWDRLGRPDPFTVVDAGAGPGTLARGVLAGSPRCGPSLRYVAVELSEQQRTRHPESVESRADLPSGPIDGVVVANELLDNLPFRLAVFDGTWREAYVTTGRPGELVEVLSAPFDPLPPTLPTNAPHGARAPLQDAAVAWLAVSRALLARGSVLVLDYARATTAELAAGSWRSWLRTYRGHDRGGHPLTAPGDQDITVDIALDQFPAPDAAQTQGQFLGRFDIDGLVAEGRTAWRAGAGGPDLATLAMRSRVREAEALLDPSGLGGFTVVEWIAGRR